MQTIKTLAERIKPHAWTTPGETGNILAHSMAESAELRAALAKNEAQMLRMATCAGEFARDACKQAAAGVPHIERDASLIPELRLAQVAEARTIGYHSAQLIMKSQDDARAFCNAVNAALALQQSEKAPGAA